MMRLGAIFVAVCMLLIAGSAGAAVYLAFGLDSTQAAIVAVVTLITLGISKIVSSQFGIGAVASKQLADLSRTGAELARQIAEIGRRTTALESKVEQTLDRTRGAIAPLSVEIGELGALVKELAETVAAHESSLGTAARTPSATAAMPSVELTSAASPASSGPMAGPPAISAAAPPSIAREEMLKTIRAAIEGNRIDLYLQPIVTLPQRKVRYYEAMSRLRTENGNIIPASDFIQHAESDGLMPKIDNLVVFRCVQVVRRLLLKNRDIGLFCNLAGSTLTDATLFPQILEFLDANRSIVPSLVLEFTQSALRAAGPIENESLSALAERGFRFSLDNVIDLRIEPRELASRGFRFIKVPANLLLSRTSEMAADIHPADLSDLLGRFGIDLIAEKIESEGSVVDLLDCDVRFGQGFLFSPPRPVRAEALQGIAERSDLVTRDSTPESIAAADEAGISEKTKRMSGLAGLARRAVGRI